MLVASNVFVEASLVELVTALRLLDGVKIALFSNDIVPTRSRAIGDFTFAGYHGYAASAAIVWGAPFVDVNGVPTVLGDLKSFTATAGDPSSELEHGYLICKGDLSAWYFAERFDAPFLVNYGATPLFILPQIQSVTQVG